MPSQFFPSRFNSTFGNPIQNGMLDPMYGKQMPSSSVSNNYLNPRGQNPRSSLIQQIYGMNGKNPMNQMGMEQNNLSAQNPYFDQLQKIGPNITSNNSLPAPGMEQRNQPINPIDIETKLKGLSLEPQINKFTSNPLLAQLGVRENKEDYDKWKNNLSENTDLYKNYQNEGLQRKDLSKIAVEKEPIFKQAQKPDMEQLGRIEAENLAKMKPSSSLSAPKTLSKHEEYEKDKLNLANMQKAYDAEVYRWNNVGHLKYKNGDTSAWNAVSSAQQKLDVAKQNFNNAEETKRHYISKNNW